MKTKKEIKDWLEKHAVNEHGVVDLRGIDFGDLTVNFSNVKAKKIDNYH